ncbi:hypothetical protein Tco_0978219 [Tanacetum coccineum]|uniref:Uncharacterized protein n=1 Tax=Tanacetum coccineum TaxID=301880 RepID=A0ABQ5ENF5_9ASTR
MRASGEWGLCAVGYVGGLVGVWGLHEFGWLGRGWGMVVGKANLLRSGDGMIDEDGKSGGHDGGCVLRVIGEVGVGAGGGGVGDWGIGGGIYKASAVGRGGLGGLAELVDFGFLGGLVVGWFLGGGAVEVRRGVGGGLVVDGSVPDGTAHILLCGAKAGCTGRGNQRGGREGRLRGKY